MRMSKSAVPLLLGISLLTAQPSLAQGGMQWRGGGGWGPGTAYARMYDPKTVGTVSGEIVSVQTLTPMPGMGYGVHMLLRMDNETISVHLGPTWYIENQDVQLEPKDRVQVRGSRVTFQGKPAIIAAEVTKGNETLRLRDDSGFPLWSGWRRR
jgi:hypothetical protein